MKGNILVEDIEREVLAHIKEGVGGGARAGRVHQVHQRALLRRK